MTGLFRLNRDLSRWKILSLSGAGILLFSSAPFLSSQWLSTIVQSNGSVSPSHLPPATSFSQADELLNAGPSIEIETIAQTKNHSHHWPPMSPEQIEQTRLTLIREGLSPMQADMILPNTTAR